jgi:hypothetical protein
VRINQDFTKREMKQPQQRHIFSFLVHALLQLLSLLLLAVLLNIGGFFTGGKLRRRPSSE